METDKKPFRPLSKEAFIRAREFLRSMTPEELMDFMEYRTPGIEETDMTGNFPIHVERPVLASAQTLQKKSA